MSDNFLDSNVLIYSIDDKAPRKKDIARGIVDRALYAKDSTISFQVIQETLNVITTKFKIRMTADDARRFLHDTLFPLWKVGKAAPSRELYVKALDLRFRYKYRFYDCLIIAAALELGCRTLYSEDMRHGHKIDQLTIENPFEEEQ